MVEETRPVVEDTQPMVQDTTTQMMERPPKNPDRRSAARRMLLKAILKNPSETLARAPAEVRTNREFLLEAITENATVLEYVSSELRNDKDFAVAAVAVNGRSFFHLPEVRQDDPAVLVAAVAKHGAHLFDGEYYMRVMRSSRAAVAEIRDEVEAEQEAQRIAFARREDRLQAELAALQAKTALLELKKKKSSFLWDSVFHSEQLCTSALHLETLRVNALQTKLDDIAKLAIDAGADEDLVNNIKSKPLQTTTVVS